MSKWAKVARKLLKKSNHPQYLMAAVLVRGGRLLSYGYNRNRPAWRFVRANTTWSIGLHAELACIYGRTRRSIQGSTIYLVGKARRTGFLINCKPCKTCQETLTSAGVKQVVYQNGKEFEILRL